MDNPPSSFKRIILISEKERLDVQYTPKADRIKYPQGFKYSFNYRAFLEGRWIPLVRWDNSHPKAKWSLHDAVATGRHTFSQALSAAAQRSRLPMRKKFPAQIGSAL